MMREHPILFSGPMVLAILDGRKTQTRRVIKPSWSRCLDLDDERDAEMAVAQCPYGVAGDELWVRETHRFTTGSEDFTLQTVRYRADADERDAGRRWRPSIHMPRWASRIRLRIEHVFVMRVQTLCVKTVRAEGIEVPDVDYTVPDHPWQLEGEQLDYAIEKFRALWDRLNAKRGFPFTDNPWVWEIHFRRIG